MKNLFVLSTWILLNSSAIAQIETFPVYDWAELKKCNPDTIYGISLEKLKLDKVPKDLERFTNLRHLNLSKNKLNELPDFIGKMIFLEQLDLSKNKFEIFPLEICRLENLQTLAANRNYFERIPDCIEYCSQLELLDLWDTPVVYFPATMQKLKKLKKLDLQGVRYNLKFQENLKMQLPWTTIQFDSPCNCMD